MTAPRVVIESHTYPAAGTYTVTLTVTDDDGLVDVTTQDVTVVELVPLTVVASEVTVNRTVQFTSTVSEPSRADTYEWDFGDGTAVDTTANPEHEYLTSDVFTVTVTVTDVDGGPDATDTIDVTTNDVPVGPTAAFTYTTTFLVVDVDASTSQPGDVPIATYEWDFGD